MSTDGRFEIEENDIVALNADCCDVERTGWVNVGVHAVKIHLTANGNLILKAYARTNERDMLAEITVKKEEAVQKGGTDPDA